MASRAGSSAIAMVHPALLVLPVASEDWWTFWADATRYGDWVKYWRETLKERGLTLAVVEPQPFSG